MIKLFLFASTLALVLSASAGQSAFKQTTVKHPRRAPLTVGWHDEMNDPALWKPLGAENPPDVYASSPGLLTLRLPHVPQGYAYAYQWSGVARSISADLAHYPVLMARVSSLQKGSYAHLQIEERDAAGRVVHSWRSPTLTQAGLTAIDLGKEIGPEVRRLTLRLIVGGTLAGAQCDYNWVRFARREDMAYLQESPDLQTVTSSEPTGDTRFLPPPKN
jgi:hypothetical protein